MSTQTITKWVIDPSHSEVEFKIKHLMISTVTGKFTSYHAELQAAKEDLTDAVVSFSADINSITTANADRDKHLLSDDFFNAEKFPQLTFKSTNVKREGNHFTVTGDLTIRDVTKSINLDVEYNGSMKDPWGNEKAGFEVTGKINRKDFNLKWSATTETGGIVVSDEVKIICNVQMVKQA